MAWCDAVKQRSFKEDALVEGQAEAGQVILNHGDPAFAARRAGQRLGAAESLFLRILAYVPFAESVCLPARFVLTSPPTFEAVRLAEPLLRAGVLRPERRAEAASFEDVATLLRLPDAGHERGRWLDAAAVAQRSFRSEGLSERYREILLSDLADTGGLRTAMDRRILEVSRAGLDAAAAAYAVTSDGTPEATGKSWDVTPRPRRGWHAAGRWRGTTPRRRCSTR